MGVMACSAPRVNRPMPTTSSTAPPRKASSTLLGTGATVRHRASMMAVTGSTERMDSKVRALRMVWWAVAALGRLEKRRFFTAGARPLPPYGIPRRFRC